MIETDDYGLAAGARTSGDDCMRFDIYPTETVDLGAEYGGQPFNKPTDRHVRNAIIASVTLTDCGPPPQKRTSDMIQQNLSQPPCPTSPFE